MQVLSLSPHALSTNAYIREFLNNLAGYTPHAPHTFTHHWAELFFFHRCGSSRKAGARQETVQRPSLFAPCDLLVDEGAHQYVLQVGLFALR